MENVYEDLASVVPACVLVADDAIFRWQYVGGIAEEDALERSWLILPFVMSR